MAMSQRISAIFQVAKERGLQQPLNTFEADMHALAKTTYRDLEKWEKLARSMAGAMVKQKIYIDDTDRIIGRIYHLNSQQVESPDPDFNHFNRPYQKLCDEIPGYAEMIQYQLIGETGFGHITWAWDSILRLGTSGMKAQYQKALERAADEKSRQFYSGVLIMLEALEQWNDKHVQALQSRGMTEMAEICQKVPRYPAETFHEAVQAFFMQYIVVMRENPFGGNGPGRLDYYLWPYLAHDLENGTCTLEQARELVDELFIRINERIYSADVWVEAVMVGGSHPDGTSAVNPLSHIMIESMMDLNITHPSVYVRFPKEAPENFVQLCARYLRAGTNRAQILSDQAIIGALMESGVPYRDAVEYTCGGCMEIGLQGMTSDFLYNGWHNLPKILELCVTGGICLKTGNRLGSVQARGLEAYSSFEAFYRDFIRETTRLLHIFFHAQDVYSEEAESSRPSYLISSMIQDCYLRGRNMHGGGARYHDYGSTPMGLPNTADYLFAIKKAVFDDHLCTAGELITALKANFEGYADLQKKLRTLPKYGQENAEADDMMAKLCRDVSEIYSSYRTRFGGKGKLIILTFIFGPQAGALLGATADGNPAGKPVAQGVTPQSSSMVKGITAAMNSCAKLPFHIFNGGASTMWDLDCAWATDEMIQSLLLTFFEKGGQIYQGNTTDVESLRKAQETPEEYHQLIVRVGGFSARFVNLDRELQDEIISRVRHAG